MKIETLGNFGFASFKWLGGTWKGRGVVVAAAFCVSLYLLRTRISKALFGIFAQPPSKPTLPLPLVSPHIPIPPQPADFFQRPDFLEGKFSQFQNLLDAKLNSLSCMSEKDLDYGWIMRLNPLQKMVNDVEKAVGEIAKSLPAWEACRIQLVELRQKEARVIWRDLSAILQDLKKVDLARQQSLKAPYDEAAKKVPHHEFPSVHAYFAYVFELDSCRFSISLGISSVADLQVLHLGEFQMFIERIRLLSAYAQIDPCFTPQIHRELGDLRARIELRRTWQIGHDFSKDVDEMLKLLPENDLDDLERHLNEFEVKDKKWQAKLLRAYVSQLYLAQGWEKIRADHGVTTLSEYCKKIGFNDLTHLYQIGSTYGFLHVTSKSNSQPTDTR